MSHLFWRVLVQTKISRLLSHRTTQGLPTLRYVYDLQEAYGLQHFPQLFEHSYIFLGTSHEVSALLTRL